MRKNSAEKRRVSGYAGRSLIIAAIGAALIAVSVAACLIAKGDPGGVTKHFTPFSRKLGGLLGRITGVVPFSVGEVMLYAMIAGFVVTFVLLLAVWRKKDGKKAIGRYFAILFLIAGCHAAFFVFSWGLNYYGQPLSEQLGIEVGMYSEEELIETTRYYIQVANECADKVQRRASDGAVDVSDTQAVYRRAVEAFREQTLFDWNGALISRPKEVMSWYALSCLDIAGIHDPFTAECIVNADCAPVSLAFTTCHELSHRLGYAPENEANFVAILLCRECDDELLRYSGGYMGFVYCFNALSKIDRAAASELWSELSPGLAADVLAANRHVEKYENKVTAQVSDAVNDVYLKIMDQSGIQSYGEVVDLLIAEYCRTK